MNSNKSSQDEWIACQQGEIGRLAHQLSNHRRAESIQRNAGLCVLFFMVAFAGYAYVDNRSNADLDFGGIACSDVRQHAEQFVAKKLDAETDRQIRQHLASCPGCRELVEQLRLKKRRRAAGGIQAEESPPVVVAMNSLNAAAGFQRSVFHR